MGFDIGYDKPKKFFEHDEYIICSAIHFINENVYNHQPKNIEKGIVICGRRHHNCFATVKGLMMDKTEFENEIQGFITNRDMFVNREEGGEIAFKAGQTLTLKTTLYSEDIY